VEIQCKHGIFRIFVNNEDILEFTHPQHTPEHALGRQFYHENAVYEGFISLKSNSQRIDFCKMEI
jgi:hypothetical protein